ncbi:MAG TPA: hypothetical protein VHO48_12185 [Anaerolineaceae bacterium]|nr:hypothetical protein [Anaerolineaceae bacterium]
MNFKRVLLVLLPLTALFWGVLHVAAQSEGPTGEPQGQTAASAVGSAFTYQGYLTDSTGKPINASCNLTFELYDALEAGNLIGLPDVLNAITVERGYFTVTLNASGKFGVQPFNGQARFLQVTVDCDGTAETLPARQPLSAAPYATFALNLPKHNHVGEKWQTTSTGAALTLTNTNVTGEALLAEGKIASTSDSKLYVNPTEMIAQNGSSDLTFTPSAGGGIVIGLPASSVIKGVQVPVSSFGTLFGAPLYVKSAKICYRATNSRINETRVVKNNSSSETGASDYIVDTAPHTSSAFTCYSITAPTPYLPIDNTTWVQFDLLGSPSSATSMEITTIELTLSEEQYS